MSKEACICVWFIFFNTAIWQTSCVTSMFIEARVLKSCLEHIALVVWGIGNRRHVRLMKTRKKFVVQWDGHSQNKVILDCLQSIDLCCRASENIPTTSCLVSGSKPCSCLTCHVASKESEAEFVCLGAGSSFVDPLFISHPGLGLYPFYFVYTAESLLVELSADSKEVRELLPWHHGIRLTFYLFGTLCLLSSQLWEEEGKPESCNARVMDSHQSSTLMSASKSAMGCGTALLVTSGAVRKEEQCRLQASFCDLKRHVMSGCAWVQKKLRSDASNLPSHKTYPATSSYSKQNPALL